MQAVLGQPLLLNTAVIYLLHVFSDIYSFLAQAPVLRREIIFHHLWTNTLGA